MRRKRATFFGRMVSRVKRSLLTLLSGDGTFKAATMNRLVQDWIVSSAATADDEIRGNIKLLRARSRDLANNSPYVKQFLRLVETNVVGPTGVALDVRSKDEAGAKSIEEAWRRWSVGPVTIDGRLNRLGLERLIVRAVARDGEVFLRFHAGREYPWGFAVEPIDADLVDESFSRPAGGEGAEVRMGIEVEASGRPIAYHVLSESGIAGRTKRVRIAAWGPTGAPEMIHVADPERVHQTRGIPWAHSVMYSLKMLDGYHEAEVVAARAGASKMGWFVRKEAGLAGEQPEGDETTEANPGTIGYAPEGYEFQAWDPDHPAAAFDPFTKAVLRAIASGLGVSYPSLTGDLREVNYSSMRSALQLERDGWEVLHGWLDARLHQPMYRAWVELALLDPRVRTASGDPASYLDVQWTARGWDWVDPKNDIESTLMELSAGLTSRARVLKRRGMPTVDVIFAELAEEQAKAKAAKITIDGPVTKGTSDAAASDSAANASANGNGDGGDAGRNRLKVEYGRIA